MADLASYDAPPSPPEAVAAEPHGLRLAVVAELHDLTALEQGDLVRAGEVSAPSSWPSTTSTRIERAADDVAARSSFARPRAARWTRAARPGARAGRRRRCSASRPRSRTST